MQALSLGGLNLLVLEDEPLLRKQAHAFLQNRGADVTSVDTIERARKVINDLNFDYALIDVNLPDGLGTDLLKDKAFSPNTGVIVMTAQGGVNGAVEAMRMGALEYLVKPFDLEEIPLLISRARRSQQTERIEEHRRKSDTEETFFFGSALAAMQTHLERIIAADKRLTDKLPPVLIQGETGTGKTTIARWLHHQGPRSSKPLVEVNCSALPETLAESELFGHERGAFTDARSARIGLFEAADGGTLFLDELPSLSLSLQAKVLKAIEDHRIRRVGGSKEIPVDIRIIAATNRDLKKVVAEGEFREDLYHRLDLYRIIIQPLRDRGEDIINLAERMLVKLFQRHRLPARKLSAVGKQRLRAYSWPGNVRELAHELERAIVFEEGAELNFDHLVGQATTPKVAGSADATDWFAPGYVFPAQGFNLEEAINRLIRHALKQTNDNVSAAARLLGVSRDYIRYRLSGKAQRADGGDIPPTEN